MILDVMGLSTMPEISEGAEVHRCPECGYESDSEMGIKVHRGWKHLDGDEERFWDKVDKGDSDECWEWQGNQTKSGYGLFEYDNKRVKATHYMITEIEDENFDSEVVMHICDNPPCVNPNHLKQGTYKENTQDCINKGRRTQNAKGEGNGFSKLTKNQVIEIKSRLENGESREEIAKDFPVSKSHIRNIDHGRFWDHIKV